MTDELLKAKKRDMLECAETLEGRLASLDNALQEFARSRSPLGRTPPDFYGQSVLIGENKLTVRNTLRCVEHIAALPWKHFDDESIKRLRLDIQDASKALNEAESALRALGF